MPWRCNAVLTLLRTPFSSQYPLQNITIIKYCRILSGFGFTNFCSQYLLYLWFPASFNWRLVISKLLGFKRASLFVCFFLIVSRHFLWWFVMWYRNFICSFLYIGSALIHICIILWFRGFGLVHLICCTAYLSLFLHLQIVFPPVRVNYYNKK